MHTMTLLTNLRSGEMLPLVDLHDLLQTDGETQGMGDTGPQRGQATPTTKQ